MVNMDIDKNGTRTIKVAVHNGSMHKDDVLTVALAIIENGMVEIVRTRDEKVLEAADIIGDVGMKYDGVRFFDHHMKEGVPIYENGVKYAACGLYLKSMKSLDERVKQYLLENALYSVQAQDNGQDIEGMAANPFTFIDRMNCDWETGVYGKEQDKAFEEAVKMSLTVLRKMIHAAKLEEKARRQIDKATGESKERGILNIGSYCPWVRQVIDMNNNGARFRTVVFSSSDGTWGVQVVPKENGKFGAWVSIPEEVKKLKGFIFRHKGAFLAKFDNEESAIKAARMAK